MVLQMAPPHVQIGADVLVDGPCEFLVQVEGDERQSGAACADADQRG